LYVNGVLLLLGLQIPRGQMSKKFGVHSQQKVPNLWRIFSLNFNVTKQPNRFRFK